MRRNPCSFARQNLAYCAVTLRLALLSLALGLHAFAGFHNLLIAQELRLSPDAAPFAGGAIYVFLAFVAGLGYGLAYHVTGRIEASILTHFLLNLTHLTLFTCPRLA